MYLIVHEREQCIGCGACAAVHPDGWRLEDDGKVTRVGPARVNSARKHQEAAAMCPVNVIKVEKVK